MSDITDINDLLKSFDNPNHCYQQRLVDAIRLLVKERDEARRDVCSMMHMTGFLGGDYAHSKGWDCFKDGHTGFSPEIQNFRDIFYGYKDKLRAERDEARREICKNVAAISASVNAKQWAQERGWDCFNDKNEADACNKAFVKSDGE